MTASGYTKTASGLPLTVGYWLRSVVNLIGRLVLAALVISAAGIVALAMTGLGVLIALAALITRYTRGNGFRYRSAGHAPQAHEPSGEGGIILEAHKTGRGWTVE